MNIATVVISCWLFKLNVSINLKLNCAIEKKLIVILDYIFHEKNMAVCQQLQTPTVTSAMF